MIMFEKTERSLNLRGVRNIPIRQPSNELSVIDLRLRRWRTNKLIYV